MKAVIVIGIVYLAFILLCVFFGEKKIKRTGDNSSKLVLANGTKASIILATLFFVALIIILI